MSHMDWRTYGSSAASRIQPSHNSGSNYYSGSNYNSGTNYSSETKYSLGSNYNLGTNYLNSHRTVDSHKVSPYNSRSTSPSTFHTDKARQRASSPETADIRRENTKNDRQPVVNDVMELVKCARKFQLINLDEVEKTLEEYKRKTTVERDENMKEELRELNTKFAALEETYKSMENKYTQAVDQKREIEEKLHKAKEDFQAKDRQIKNLEKIVSDKDAELTRISKEKDAALSRLSKEMGDKLTKENTAIADLSDPNRSTKLAELYNSIYDNEWTDALETLQKLGLDEEHAVRTLLEIMKHIYEFCKIAKSEHLQQLEMHMLSPFSHRQAWSTQSTPTNKAQTQIRDMLANCVKLAAKEIVPALTTNYLTMKSKSTHVERVPEYAGKAMELCWLMNLASPPLVFGDQPRTGETIDKDLYREYTKQGDMVSFVVWLPLLIEENGTVLLKGVAQPIPSVTKPGRSTVKERLTDKKNKEELRPEKQHKSTEDDVLKLFDSNATGRVHLSKHTEPALGSKNALYGNEFGQESKSAASYERETKPTSDFTKTYKERKQHDNRTETDRGTPHRYDDDTKTGTHLQNYDISSTTDRRRTNAHQTDAQQYTSVTKKLDNERSASHIDNVEYGYHGKKLIYRILPNKQWYYVSKDTGDTDA